MWLWLNISLEPNIRIAPIYINVQIIQKVKPVSCQYTGQTNMNIFKEDWVPHLTEELVIERMISKIVFI